MRAQEILTRVRCNFRRFPQYHPRFILIAAVRLHISWHHELGRLPLSADCSGQVTGKQIWFRTSFRQPHLVTFYVVHTQLCAEQLLPALLLLLLRKQPPVPPSRSRDFGLDCQGTQEPGSLAQVGRPTSAHTKMHLHACMSTRELACRDTPDQVSVGRSSVAPVRQGSLGTLSRVLLAIMQSSGGSKRSDTLSHGTHAASLQDALPDVRPIAPCNLL